MGIYKQHHVAPIPLVFCAETFHLYDVEARRTTEQQKNAPTKNKYYEKPIKEMARTKKEKQKQKHWSINVIDCVRIAKDMKRQNKNT